MPKQNLTADDLDHVDVATRAEAQLQFHGVVQTSTAEGMISLIRQLQRQVNLATWELEAVRLREDPLEWR